MKIKYNYEKQQYLFKHYAHHHATRNNQTETQNVYLIINYKQKLSIATIVVDNNFNRVTYCQQL